MYVTFTCLHSSGLLASNFLPNSFFKKDALEDSLTDLWDNIKRTNIRIIGVPEEEKKKKGTDKIFEEIIVENFPNMGKEIVNQVQVLQRQFCTIRSLLGGFSGGAVVERDRKSVV